MEQEANAQDWHRKLVESQDRARVQLARPQINIKIQKTFPSFTVNRAWLRITPVGADFYYWITGDKQTDAYSVLLTTINSSVVIIPYVKEAHVGHIPPNGLKDVNQINNFGAWTEKHVTKRDYANVSFLKEQIGAAVQQKFDNFKIDRAWEQITAGGNYFYWLTGAPGDVQVTANIFKAVVGIPEPRLVYATDGHQDPPV